MKSTASKLAKFVAEVSYEKLPDQILDYSKMLLLDSVVCGLAASTMERSRMIHAVLRQIGVKGEARVFGLQYGFPAPSAAAANAEIMNLLDADDLFRGHFAVINTAVGLAEAQRRGSSGRDLIRAFSLGWEINARLAALQPPGYNVEENGEIVWRNGPGGIGFAATGGTVTAAILMGLDPVRLAHAINLSAWKVPCPSFVDFKRQPRWSSLKYANYFDVTQSSVLSAYMAETGYVGEGDELDSTWSHLRMVGIEPEALDFGSPIAESSWLLMRSVMKRYPACGFLAPLVEALERLISRHDIDPDRVEEVVASLHPAADAMAVCRGQADALDVGHRMPLGLAFDIRYLLAMVLLRIPPGPAWFSEAVVNNERVRCLMNRVRTFVDESATRSLRQSGRSARLQHGVKLRLHGGTVFEDSTGICLGDPSLPQTRMTWPLLREKMTRFCGTLLTESRIEGIYRTFRSLEDVDDIRDVALENYI